MTTASQGDDFKLESQAVGISSLALLGRVLDRIQCAAKEADEKAEEACKKSKYSIQDYWMCMEFWAQRLHDDLAREHGLDRRCPHYPFRKKLADFKRDVSGRPNADSTTPGVITEQPK